MKTILAVLFSVVLFAVPVFANEGHGHSHSGGGDHGGNNGGGPGGNGGGPSVSAPSTPSVSGGASADGGAFLVIGGKGISAADRDKLVEDVKACEMERPGLAIGDTRADGSWSFQTFDDTIWPYIYRCMKARGHQPNGPDYSAAQATTDRPVLVDGTRGGSTTTDFGDKSGRSHQF